MSQQTEECQDKLLNGQCTKGKDCEICNKKVKDKMKELELNTNAKVFVPKKKKEKVETINLNVNASEYIPIENRNNLENKKNNMPVESNDLNQEYIDQDELDKFEDDLAEEDIMAEMEESDDEDKWFPQYQNCECCKGFVYRCKGETCKSLGQCFCKMKDDCEEKLEV